MEDFDKYKVLEMVEQLRNVAAELKDKKADYLRSVHSTLLERIFKPKEQFKSYVLTMIGDKDYEKMIESVNKIDRSYFEKQTPKYAAVPALPVPNYPYPPPPFRSKSDGFNQSGVLTFQAPLPPPPLFASNPRRFSPYPNNSNDRGVRQFTCFFCGKRGHTSRYCFHKRALEQQRK
eukprot:Seg897.9 transcript_id=Seg897.9/GoldUCD/mRNA.D3Y31 product="hypothetical protein" protein_id=Seg897.9/GoldUCD/D3Y31